METVGKNIMLKLSGEAFGHDGKAFDPEIIDSYADAIAEGLSYRKHIYCVCGGGNVCRGRTYQGAVLADYAGMLASIQNGLFLTIALSQRGIRSQLVIPDNFTIPNGCHEADIAEDTQVVIYGGGVGAPGHSTDYVCAVKSAEHHCDIYFAKTGTDGVYDSDPNKNPNAVFIPSLTFAQIVREGLHVIDTEAAELLAPTDCRGYVFRLTAENIKAMLCGQTRNIQKTEIVQ